MPLYASVRNCSPLGVVKEAQLGRAFTSSRCDTFPSFEHRKVCLAARNLLRTGLRWLLALDTLPGGPVQPLYSTLHEWLVFTLVLVPRFLLLTSMRSVDGHGTGAVCVVWASGRTARASVCSSSTLCAHSLKLFGRVVCLYGIRFGCIAVLRKLSVIGRWQKLVSAQMSHVRLACDNAGVVS